MHDSATAARLWDGPTPAVRDAAPLPGAHPTVLRFTAAGVRTRRERIAPRWRSAGG